MVEAGTLAINADIVKEATTDANTTAIGEAFTNVYILKAEGKICLDTRFDWVTNFSSISDIGKEILREAVSCYTAIMVINHDYSGFVDVQTALTHVNTLWARYIDIVKRIVEDNKYKEFILSGAGDID